MATTEKLKPSVKADHEPVREPDKLIILLDVQPEDFYLEILNTLKRSPKTMRAAIRDLSKSFDCYEAYNFDH